MKNLRLIFRLFLIAIHILYAIIFFLFFSKNKYKITPAQWQRVQNWHKRLLKISGVELTLVGKIKKDAYLVISNHISWLDIPVINSVMQTSFVAKAEISKWPIIGHFTRMVGCIFMPRGQHGAAQKVKEKVIEHIDSGLSILVFPEGTTTDGTQTRRFHSKLLAAAEDKKETVLILALSYPSSKHAVFIGEQSFFNNIIDVLKQPKTFAQITVVETLKTDKTSKQLAKYSEDAVNRIILAHS